MVPPCLAGRVRTYIDEKLSPKQGKDTAQDSKMQTYIKMQASTAVRGDSLRAKIRYEKRERERMQALNLRLRMYVYVH